jgi:hypothetical protein
MPSQAPQGGIRREQFLFLVDGAHTTPEVIEVKVYKDHQASPDSALSAEATANLSEVSTGVYRYSYSVAGIRAGTHLLDEIVASVNPGDPSRVWKMLDAIVEGVLDSTLATSSTESITLRLTGGSC